MSNRTVRFEIDIPAPRDAVWAVLSDLDRYPEWNPFTHRVETSRKIGDPVVLHVRMGKKNMTMKEKVYAWDPPNKLAWGLPILGGLLLDCCRYQELHDLGNGRTRYVTHETFHGPLAGLVMLTQEAKVHAGFEANGKALSERVLALLARGELRSATTGTEGTP